MPGRLDEFALGSTFKPGPDEDPRNAVTMTGNNLDSNVVKAANTQPTTGQARSQGLV